MSFDARALDNAHIRGQSERAVWNFVPGQNCSVDEHVAEFNAFLLTQARRIFGSPPKSPSKGWISDS
eukprot:1492633-Pyramimonas_sp.AAC.1